MARAHARRSQDAVRRAGAIRLRHRRGASARCRRVAARRSTKRTASASGDTTSARAICASRRCARSSAGRRRSRSRRRRRRTSARHRRAARARRSPKTIITGFDRTNLDVSRRADAQTTPTRTTRSSHLLQAVRRASPSSTRPRAKAVEKVVADCSSARASGRGVSRRPRRRASPRRAGRVHDREGARDRRDERVRHGHRQAQRAARHSPRDARHARGVLSGSGPRRPRRQARRRAFCCTRFPIASRTSSSSRARIRSERLVEEVYERAAAQLPTERRASTSRRDDIACGAAGKVSDREVESALRLLAQVGAYSRRSRDTGTRVLVRLLATPERIKRELGRASDTHGARAAARALARRGDALNDGASIDLDGLAAGLRRTHAAPCSSSTRWSARSSSSGSGSVAATALTDAASPALRLSASTGHALDRRRKAEISKARRDAAVRLHERLSPRLRPSLLRRSGGAQRLRRLRQLPRHARRGRARSARRRCAARRVRSEDSTRERRHARTPSKPTTRRC